VDTPVEIRELQADEMPAAWELGRLAFGLSSPPPQSPIAVPGLTRYGAFDRRGQLVGRATDLHHEQWWSGRPVAAADIASVAVLPEARGRGVARSLLGAILRGARDRGAAISALFPTVAAPYRSCGWETGGTLRTVDLSTMALPRHRPAPHLSVSPGTAADLPAVAELYERVARHRCGLLTRRGPLFDDTGEAAALPPGVDGLTLVHDGDRLVGYASWERGQGYDATAVLSVLDLFAVTAEAARELVGVLAGWRSVTPTLRLCLLGHDAVSAQLPLEIAREHQRQMWMHRPVDVVRAVQSRGWPPQVRGEVVFALDDVLAPWNTGSWRLEVADGSASLQRTDSEPALRLAVQGFGLLYLGATTAQAVAEAGLLHCAPGTHPGALDLLGAGQQAELLDYF
jgi:predicted acetyltransferase